MSPLATHNATFINAETDRLAQPTVWDRVPRDQCVDRVPPNAEQDQQPLLLGGVQAAAHRDGPRRDEGVCDDGLKSDELVAANPYPKSDAVHCAFLPASPTKAAHAKLDTIEPTEIAPSRFAVGTREVYLDLPSGVGRNKLADKVVRTFPDATLRSWRTVVRLAEMVDPV